MRRSGAHGTNPQSRLHGAIVLLRQDIVKDTPVPDVVKSLDFLENETGVFRSESFRLGLLWGGVDPSGRSCQAARSLIRAGDKGCAAAK
jgi:hypothetical protein